MPKAALAVVVRYSDRLLRTAEIGDYDGAANGLQVENRGVVTRIAAAVDASLATVKLAIAAKADLLVQHGLFWSPSHPWTGKKYELLRTLLDHDPAVYSSHLPLDAHPRLGNNAQLCASLGFKKLRPFFESHGQTIGFRSATLLSRAELATCLVQRAGQLDEQADDFCFQVIQGHHSIRHCVAFGTPILHSGQRHRDYAIAGSDLFKQNRTQCSPPNP